jgi:hypothetical protein
VTLDAVAPEEFQIPTSTMMRFPAAIAEAGVTARDATPPV